MQTRTAREVEAYRFERSRVYLASSDSKMMIIGVLSPAHRCACQGHRLDRKLYLEYVIEDSVSGRAVA
jgi:hypothetical protein